jgi:hypothetical protein
MACCITARANGIRAKPCRAGPSRSTGATDGQPIWTDPALIAREGAHHRHRSHASDAEAASSTDRQKPRASTGDTFRPMRTRRMAAQGSEPAAQRGPGQFRAADPEARHRIAACSSAASPSPRASSCRSSAGRRGHRPAGAPRSGRRGAAASSSCPATARSATACRWLAALMPPPTIPMSSTHGSDRTRHRCRTRSRSRPSLLDRARRSSPPIRAPRPPRPSRPRATRRTREQVPARSKAGAHRAHRRIRATGGCASSCRRSSGSRTISNCRAAEAAARETRPAGAYRRLRAAARPAPQRDPRGPRSGRDRGQHPPGVQLGRIAWRSPPPSTRKPASPGWAPTSS